MKKSGVVYLGNSKFVALVRDNLLIVIFTLIFALGVLFSALPFLSSLLKNPSQEILSLYLNSRLENAFFEQFFTTFLISFSFIFSAFVFGASLMGLAFVPFIIFSRGLLSGLLLGALYSQYGLSGIVVNLLSVIPGTVICVLALINVSSDSLNLSYSICKTVIGSNSVGYKFKFVNLLKKYAVALFITIIGSLFEVLLFNVFKKFLELR
ncbi:MAG: hypothetical protein U0M42_01400 [Acutalibacteraceae bacterium]|nr:hypothetical protein [Acutalibacteraceae bacterium]